MGIDFEVIRLEENTLESDVISLLDKLNNDHKVNGILIQSPIPEHLNYNKLTNLINYNKDVDGFGNNNVYYNYLNEEKMLPCTVKGIISLLAYYNIALDGSHVVIVGRGNIVGKPLFNALLNRNATVTVCHTHTKDLKSITKTADILISATGVAHLIKEDFVKDGAVVIDVGIARINGKICGDVDFEGVSKKAAYITPVPGGVGPMTVAMLLENVYETTIIGKEK